MNRIRAALSELRRNAAPYTALYLWGTVTAFLILAGAFALLAFLGWAVT